jgi:hypothetical protein
MLPFGSRVLPENNQISTILIISITGRSIKPHGSKQYLCDASRMIFLQGEI